MKHEREENIDEMPSSHVASQQKKNAIQPNPHTESPRKKRQKDVKLAKSQQKADIRPYETLQEVLNNLNNQNDLLNHKKQQIRKYPEQTSDVPSPYHDTHPKRRTELTLRELKGEFPHNPQTPKSEPDRVYWKEPSPRTRFLTNWHALPEQQKDFARRNYGAKTPSPKKSARKLTYESSDESSDRENEIELYSQQSAEMSNSNSESSITPTRCDEFSSESQPLTIVEAIKNYKNLAEIEIRGLQMIVNDPMLERLNATDSQAILNSIKLAQLQELNNLIITNFTKLQSLLNQLNNLTLESEQDESTKYKLSQRIQKDLKRDILFINQIEDTIEHYLKQLDTFSDFFILETNEDETETESLSFTKISEFLGKKSPENLTDDTALCRQLMTTATDFITKLTTTEMDDEVTRFTQKHQLRKCLKEVVKQSADNIDENNLPTLVM